MMPSFLTPILEREWHKWAKSACDQPMLRAQLLGYWNDPNPMARDAAFRMATAILTTFRDPKNDDQAQAIGAAEDVVLDLLTGEMDAHLLEEYAVMIADLACDHDAVCVAMNRVIKAIPRVSLPRLNDALWWQTPPKCPHLSPKPNGYFLAGYLAKLLDQACAPEQISTWPMHPTRSWVADQLRQNWERGDWVRNPLWQPHGDRLVCRSVDHTFVANHQSLVAGYYHQDWHGGIKPFCTQQFFCATELVVTKVRCPEAFFNQHQPEKLAYFYRLRNLAVSVSEAS